MPYVDLFSSDDYASIYYTTSSPYNNVGGFDPAKPTLLVLHPLLLDTTWLDCQFGDPRLHKDFNIIAFDTRSAGKSTCVPNGRRDSWVDAADIAYCHQMLHLPPCHVFALESTSVNCALRFPEMCLSLALCNIPAPVEESWNYSAFDELMLRWCFSPDLESLEHAVAEAISLLFGPTCDPDLKDEVAAHWQKSMPPTRRPWSAECCQLMLNRTALTPEMHEEISQPVLIIHGEAYPRKHAEVLASQLVNAGDGDGAVIYTVKGAGAYLSVIPTSASIVNNVLAKFLARLPPTRSDIVPPPKSISERMSAALEFQGALTGIKGKGDLDPMSPLSFSCLPPSVVKRQAAVLAEYSKGRLLAFNPLGPDGRPLRKLSEGKTVHWFSGGQDGLSVADSATFNPAERDSRPGKGGNSSSSTGEKNSSSSGSAQNDGKLVKSQVNPLAVEKYYIKGSMAKVVREPTATFGRVLL